MVDYKEEIIAWQRVNIFRVPGSEFPGVLQMLFHVSDTSGLHTRTTNSAGEFYKRLSLLSFFKGFFENFS